MDYVRAFEMAYDAWEIQEDALYQDVYLGHMDDFANELGISRDQVYAAFMAIEKEWQITFELDNRNEVIVSA